MKRVNQHTDDNWVEDNPTAAAMKPRGDVWEQTRQRADRARTRTQLFLRENPLPLALGALALGLLAGVALRYAFEEREKSRFASSRLGAGIFEYLWPTYKTLREKYGDSADAVKESVERYAKPIRKQWKSWIG